MFHTCLKGTPLSTAFAVMPKGSWEKIHSKKVPHGIQWTTSHHCRAVPGHFQAVHASLALGAHSESWTISLQSLGTSRVEKQKLKLIAGGKNVRTISLCQGNKKRFPKGGNC